MEITHLKIIKKEKKFYIFSVKFRDLSIEL